MRTFEEIREIRDFVKEQKLKGKKIGFVPTMGALHSGHLSLIKKAKENSDLVISSIFVNPAQFAPHEDFDSYPRTIEDDLQKLKSENCDALFLPKKSDLYDENFSTEITITQNADILCGKSRPHFFHGIGLVITKLFNIIHPDVAVFGEKDFQQLFLIRKLVKDLNFDTGIIGGEIIRESDGLAMSSRNKYLSEEERKIAPKLYQELTGLAKTLKKSDARNAIDLVEISKSNLINQGFNNIDYLEVRDETNLNLVEKINENSRIFVAVNLGKTRLIDNLKV